MSQQKIDEMTAALVRLMYDTAEFTGFVWTQQATPEKFLKLYRDLVVKEHAAQADPVEPYQRNRDQRGW